MAKDNNPQAPAERGENQNSPQKDAQGLLPQNPRDKFPTLYPMVEKLEKEKETIMKKSEPFRRKREELLRQIQPLENELRKIDEKIKEAERPRLPQINNELGALAKAMGGRSMNQGNQSVEE